MSFLIKCCWDFCLPNNMSLLDGFDAWLRKMTTVDFQSSAVAVNMASTVICNTVKVGKSEHLILGESN